MYKVINYLIKIVKTMYRTKSVSVRENSIKKKVGINQEISAVHRGVEKTGSSFRLPDDHNDY